MNYIYDVLGNFNNELLDFYEWDKNDNIIHIRKIPMYKINTKILLDFKYNNIKVNKEFLKSIKNRTEIFFNKSIEYIEYSSIFTDGNDLIIIEFDSKGNSILKSLMLLDEAEEVYEESEFIDEYDIKYTVIEKENNIDFKTRKERTIFKYLKKEIDRLIDNSNFNKLKYLYYEWYNLKIDDMDKISKDLYKILDIEFCDKHNYFYNLIKFSNTKKIEQK